jgi:hypothetical protein
MLGNYLFRNVAQLSFGTYKAILDWRLPSRQTPRRKHLLEIEVAFGCDSFFKNIASLLPTLFSYHLAHLQSNESVLGDR